MTRWQDMRPESRRDAVVGGVLAIFFAWLLTFGVRFGVAYPAGTGMALTAPSLFPYILSMLGVLFSLFVVIGALFFPPAPVDEEEEDLTLPLITSVLRFTLVFVLLISYYYFFRRIGALPMSMIAFGILLYIGGERRPLYLTLITVLLPLGTYLLFVRLANVPLPRGLMPF